MYNREKEQLFGTSSTEAEVEIDSIFGAYLLAHIEMTGSASVYGNFGLGLNYEVLDNILLNTEYISYVNGDDFSASVLSLGILFYSRQWFCEECQGLKRCFVIEMSITCLVAELKIEGSHRFYFQF